MSTEIASFEHATAIKAVDSYTYSGFFHNSWCMGSVPHGGYVTSCILAVASRHFETTLKAQNQPHTMALNVNFLRRTAEGPAIFVVQDVKLGRQTSVIHITVSQGSSREKVVGYLTRSNLETESGISLPTAWTLVPPPYPANLSLLMGGSDKQWERYDSAPFLEFRKASARVDFYLPRNGQLEKSIIDEWIRFASGELFTMGSLGYVADMFPQIIESYRETLPSTEKHQWGRLWYPTILLNLEMKKLLPPEGVQWLFVRVLAKQIKNGRMDLEVVVMDEGGDLIALSQHVCMIVGIERNTAERRDVPEKIAVKL